MGCICSFTLAVLRRLQGSRTRGDLSTTKYGLAMFGACNAVDTGQRTCYLKVWRHSTHSARVSSYSCARKGGPGLLLAIPCFVKAACFFEFLSCYRVGLCFVFGMSRKTQCQHL